MGYMGIADAVWAQYNALTGELSKRRYGSTEYKEIAAKITSFERQQILDGNRNFAELNVVDPLCDMVQGGIDDAYTKEVLVGYIVWFKQNGFNQYADEILKWAPAEAREVLAQAS